MKKYLLVFFLFSFSTIIYAQSYTPMLLLGKTWNMHHYDNFFPNYNYDFNITLDYTTTINGTEYFHATNGMLFREDATNKKIYKLNNAVEELILDFDLIIGDDLVSPLIIMDDTNFSRSITTIGTGTFYGVPNLKFYETDCGEKIIEGIGVFRIGLFDISSSCSTVDFDTGDYMINMNSLTIKDFFSENNIQLFFNSDNNELQMINSNQYFSLQLFSILGKKIFQTQIKNTFSASQLKKGIYFYKLSNNNVSKKGKILIF